MIIFSLIYSIIKLYIVLDIFQQSHYNIKAYLSYFLFNFLFYNLCPLFCVIFSDVLSNNIVTIICGVYIIFYSLISLVVKVKLKFTNRIIKLLIISIVYCIGLAFVPYVSYYLLILIEFSLVPIFYLDVKLSKLLNKKYITLSKSKIADYKGKKIIITGSYGKTSTKNLLEQVLNFYSPTVKTPKSYNTLLGISKFINSTPIDAYSNLILEYGASRINDISELIDYCSPDLAIITGIGYMHMNGFKKIENVIAEKMKLYEVARIAILNYDNQFIREYTKKDNVILSYGLNHGDYNARNIDKGSFDFYYKDAFIIHFDTKLYSEHQILNLLACLAYIHYFKYDLNILKNGIKMIKSESNRLEPKIIGGRLVLDDSFNSNPQGFNDALKCLSKYNNLRIIITPGIVELGKYKTKINADLALNISASVDIAIIVGGKEANNLYYQLKKYKIELYRTQTFIEAYNLYLKLVKGKDSTLLIENDLPDIYKRRVLF
ncbi:MAG: Mur ligase family protein [Anaeroplasma sp.]